MSIAIDYTAKVAREYILNRGRIVAVGTQRRELRPLELQLRPPLYAKFSSLDDDPESFVQFIEAYGPLTREGDLRGERVIDLVSMRGRIAYMIGLSNSNPSKLLEFDFVSAGRGTAIRSSWQRQAAKINVIAKRGAIAPMRGASIPSAAINVVGALRAGPPDNRPVLAFSADSLWDALLLQLYMAITSGARVKPCAWCRGPIEIGPGPDAKRDDAKFCSDKCRQRHFQARNKGARR